MSLLRLYFIRIGKFLLLFAVTYLVWSVVRYRYLHSGLSWEELAVHWRDILLWEG